MQTAGILSIGAELTLGQTVDTNTAWLARQCAALGIRASEHRTVSDELEPIREAISALAQSSDVVLVTGGLGPTADDLTREAVAATTGVALREDPEALAAIQAFFAGRGRAMPDRNRVQARVPVGGHVLPNACGTAPGITIELAGTPVFCMPGVPFEMRAMFNEQVRPFIAQRSRGGVIHSRLIHCTGTGESDIGTQIEDLMTRGANPEVGTTAALGIIGVRVNARAANEAAALALADETEATVRERLGALVFGRDEQTLAQMTGELLAERGATLGLAESCTGGLIGKLITDTPGASRYFRGGVISYANNIKQDLLSVDQDVLASEGAVCGAIAEQMAAGARRQLGADYALAVTGIAGPGADDTAKPVGLVYIGLASPAEVRHREFRFGSDAPRDVIRMRAALTALNLLRTTLLAQ